MPVFGPSATPLDAPRSVCYSSVMRRFCRQPEEHQTMIDHLIGAIEGLTIFLAVAALTPKE